MYLTYVESTDHEWEDVREPVQIKENFDIFGHLHYLCILHYVTASKYWYNFQIIDKVIKVI